jgi:3-deoxy-D-manno-octulosonate 8-phosphate phosphatase (KDO 8-P phosphatase)
MAQLRAQHCLDFAQAGYMGNDIVDLPLQRACGCSATAADCHPMVTDHVRRASQTEGCKGAVHEVCDSILAAQYKLDAALARCLV